MQVLKDEVREAILKAAAELFLDCGYRDTTMRAIAGMIRMSVSNLYKYFPDKSALWGQLVKGFYSRFREASASFLNEENDGNYTEANIRSVSERLGGILTTHRTSFLLLMRNPEAPCFNDLASILRETMTEHILAGTNPATGYDRVLVSTIVDQIWSGVTAIVAASDGIDQLLPRLERLLRYHFHGLSLFHDVIPVFEET